MSLVKAKVSTIVSKQVPEFIREDNPAFVSFLRAYYDFLEENYPKRNLETIRDMDQTVDDFVEYVENELMLSIPKNILADRALLAKHIKQIYDSKGNISSYELLFKILFDEPVELYFPKVDILRVSDGKWSQSKKVRVTANIGDPLQLAGQFLYQGSSRLGVDSIIKIRLLNESVYEITVTDNSIVGDIQANETMNGVSNIDGSAIVVDVKSILTSMDVINSGSYYTVNRDVKVVSGSGRLATANIAAISAGKVTEVLVNYGGSGYKVGDSIQFDNTDCGIDNKAIKVSATAVVSEIDTFSITLEDDSGYVTLENKSKITKEDAGLYGPIKKVDVIIQGERYGKLPIASAPSSVTADYASFTVLGPDIGRVIKVNVTDPGVDYESTAFGKFDTNVLLTKKVGEFAENEEVYILPQTLALETGDEILLEDDSSRIVLERQSSATGTISQFDVDRNLYRLNPSSYQTKIVLEDESGYILDHQDSTIVTEDSEYWNVNQTLVGVNTGATGRIADLGQAFSRGNYGAVYNSVGKLLNADGKIGDSSKKIQDSKYYQDYSYVIGSRQSTNVYREAVKKLLHPIGLAMFGNVKTQSVIGSTSGSVNFVKGSPGVPVGRLTLYIKDLVFGGIRAFSRYRTPYESHPNINKLEMTFIITDFVRAHLTAFTTNPEFLPELDVPRMTPDQVHLLDLRTDWAGDTWILYIIKMLNMQVTVTKQITLSFPSSSHLVCGPTWKSLEQFKFNLPPYTAGSKFLTGYTDEWDAKYAGSNNADYWAPYGYPEFQFGNTQMVTYADVVIGEVINNQTKKINFAIDSFVDVIYLPTIITYDMTTITQDSTAYSVDSNG